MARSAGPRRSVEVELELELDMCDCSSRRRNIPYGFNESDMLISLQQLFAFLEENDETPFKALKYCIGECNYGGRVTDGKDRITLNSIMERFFNEDVLETGYKMSDSGTYSIPAASTREEFLEVIEQLPLVAPPEIFGADSAREMNLNFL